MNRTYTKDDELAMQRIADGAVIDNVAELTKMLGDKDLSTKLTALEADPDFRDRLEELIMRLDHLLDTAKSRSRLLKL